MTESLSIDRKKFWHYVNVKLKRLINFSHVFSIIIILFEEMIKDLVAGKELKIFNFGKLVLKKQNSKKYFDVRYQKVMECKGNKILKFNLAPKLKKKLYKNIDIDKTFIKD